MGVLVEELKQRQETLEADANPLTGVVFKEERYLRESTEATCNQYIQLLPFLKVLKWRV